MSLTTNCVPQEKRSGSVKTLHSEIEKKKKKKERSKQNKTNKATTVESTRAAVLCGTVSSSLTYMYLNSQKKMRVWGKQT